MLSEHTIGSLMVERLRQFLPSAMQISCLLMPDKPELITADVIKTKHPGGALFVGFSESEGTGGSEVQLYGVDCVSVGVERNEALATFCKLALTGWQIPGATRFEFHDNKLKAQEMGIMVRQIRFRCTVPAVKTPEGNIETEVSKLNL